MTCDDNHVQPIEVHRPDPMDAPLRTWKWKLVTAHCFVSTVCACLSGFVLSGRWGVASAFFAGYGVALLMAGGIGLYIERKLRSEQ